MKTYDIGVDDIAHVAKEVEIYIHSEESRVTGWTRQGLEQVIAAEIPFPLCELGERLVMGPAEVREYFNLDADDALIFGGGDRAEAVASATDDEIREVLDKGYEIVYAAWTEVREYVGDTLLFKRSHTTLARRAATFHNYTRAAECIKQCQVDPEAWALYCDWHESTPNTEEMSADQTVRSIEMFREERN